MAPESQVFQDDKGHGSVSPFQQHRRIHLAVRLFTLLLMRGALDMCPTLYRHELQECHLVWCLLLLVQWQWEKGRCDGFGLLCNVWIARQPKAGVAELHGADWLVGLVVIRFRMQRARQRAGRLPVTRSSLGCISFLPRQPEKHFCKHGLHGRAALM